jgi:hypothetical protein
MLVDNGKREGPYLSGPCGRYRMIVDLILVEAGGVEPVATNLLKADFIRVSTLPLPYFLCPWSVRKVIISNQKFKPLLTEILALGRAWSAAVICSSN